MELEEVALGDLPGLICDLGVEADVPEGEGPCREFILILEVEGILRLEMRCASPQREAKG